MTEDEDDDSYLLATWPNCVTPDCEHKCCTWSGTAYCFTCAERRIGRAELIRRFNATHDIKWEEAARLDAEEDARELLGEAVTITGGSFSSKTPR